MKKRVCIIGGGAAGFFGAIHLADLNPSVEVIILEKSSQVLGKVKVSGGGRCNVTHACFDPRELVRFYPRGSKELLGPFHQFQPADVVTWFEERGVRLKAEDDGRMFPVTDSSQTIIDCFLREAKSLGVTIRYRCGVQAMRREAENWIVSTTDGDEISCQAVMVTTGSSPQMWDMLTGLGHTIVEPVPSLFTLNINHPLLEGLAGISLPAAEVTGCDVQTTGPVLITHWGLSGPAILKLSAFAARQWHAAGYNAEIIVNWTGIEAEDQLDILKYMRDEFARKMALNVPPKGIPASFWKSVLACCKLDKKWSDFSNRDLQAIADVLCSSRFDVTGKSTFKEEFVTAGGVRLSEVNFKTMESKSLTGLHFAGEVLDIDAVTGGFNFQAAWTTSVLAARHIAERLSAGC